MFARPLRGFPRPHSRPSAAVPPWRVYRPRPHSRPSARQPAPPAQQVPSSRLGVWGGRPAPFTGVNCCRYLTRKVTAVNNVKAAMYIVNLQMYTSQMLKRFAPAPIKYYGGFPPPHSHPGRGCVLPASPRLPGCALAARRGMFARPPLGGSLVRFAAFGGRSAVAGLRPRPLRGLRRPGRPPSPPLAPHPPHGRVSRQVAGH